MSRTIKVHTPAGRVRVLHREGRKRHSPPFDSFDDKAENPLNGAAPDGSGKELPAVSLEQRLQEEFQAGFDEGRRFTEKTLRDELARELSENRKLVDAMTSTIIREYQNLLAEAETTLVRLAFGIAERIVKKELTADGEVVLRQIHEATKRVIGVERIKLRVNPQDEELVRDHRSQILTSADAVRDLVIEGDDTIDRGGCILESDAGNVDALIATQLDRIEAALRGEQDKKQ